MEGDVLRLISSVYEEPGLFWERSKCRPWFFIDVAFALNKVFVDYIFNILIISVSV